VLEVRGTVTAFSVRFDGLVAVDASEVRPALTLQLSSVTESQRFVNG